LYIFNARSLARALRAGQVTEGEKALYFVVGSVIQAGLAGWRSVYGGSRSDLRLYALSAVVLGMGVYVCYRANAAGDGERFLERYVCLSVPLTIWMMLVGFVAGAILMYGLGLRGGAYETVGYVLSSLLWIGYFGTMRWLIAEASRVVTS
jgi:hypothetical protein